MMDANLKNFIDAINSDVDRQIEEMLSEAEDKRTDILKNAETEALNEQYIRIRSAVTEAERKEKMIVSKEEQTSKINLLTHREELVQKIFRKVEEKIMDFVQTPDYEDYLLGLLESEKIHDNTVIFLKPDDMKYVNTLKETQRSNCVFMEEPSIKYGGLSIYDKSTSVLIDKTIDNMLDEEKKGFSSKYRLA